MGLNKSEQSTLGRVCYGHLTVRSESFKCSLGTMEAEARMYYITALKHCHNPQTLSSALNMVTTRKTPALDTGQIQHMLK